MKKNTTLRGSRGSAKPGTDAWLEHEVHQRARSWFPHTPDVSAIAIEHFGSVQDGRGIVKITLGLHGKKGVVQKVVYGNMGPLKDIKILWGIFFFLWNHGFSRPPLMSPRPLAFVPAGHLFFYEEFSGIRVRDGVEQGKINATKLRWIVGQSSKWLHRLHTTRTTLGQSRPAPLSLALFKKLLRHENLGSQFLAMNRVLRSIHFKEVLLHGDPHLANIILGPKGRVAVIDYSEAHRGHPLEDIGMYLAHLDVALINLVSMTEAKNIRRHMIESYFGRPTARIDAAILHHVLVYRMRAAFAFLRFTDNIHQKPSKDIQVIINRFVSVIQESAEELDQAHPHVSW